ncbi:MAG: 2,3-bisphosphoglycerate-independent phosphoglycerate mutase [Bdellovibrionales bacterium]
MTSDAHTPKKPVVLCILDGWGIGDGGEHDGIATAKTPNWDKFSSQYPSSTLITYGPDVGLPEGQMGNSDVGHTNIGAGRIVRQPLPRVNEAFESGSINENAHLLSFIDDLKNKGNTCHLMGLASHGGVHADIKHIMKMAEILDNAGVTVKIHAFTDGRDTSPKCADDAIKELQEHCDRLSNTNIVTVSGRYYAMDRDKRWERVSKAFNAISHAKTTMRASTALEAVEKAYSEDITDEFIHPTVIGDYRGIQPREGILFANFRADRAREILQALKYETFDDFDRGDYNPKAHAALGMVPYSKELDEYMKALFPAPLIKNNLGETIAKAGLTQIRIAETEKYPHVTFFFNSGNEVPFEGEDRTMPDSPKVDTYDLAPAMAAEEVRNRVIKALKDGAYDAVIVNFANPDMVGHSGDINAVRKACETVDEALGEIVPLVLEKEGKIIITADHGNADCMWDENKNEPHTAHTLNPVPVVVITKEGASFQLKEGTLADLAPTMLELMDVEKPKEMTGQSLILG